MSNLKYLSTVFRDGTDYSDHLSLTKYLILTCKMYRNHVITLLSNSLIWPHNVQLCVRSMASLETIGPLMAGMKSRADMAGLACEALNRMFQKEQTELVAQVSCGCLLNFPCYCSK